MQSIPNIRMNGEKSTSWIILFYFVFCFLLFLMVCIIFHSRIIEMFLPISQYYAYAPQQSNRSRKKELKPHNGWTNDMNRTVENAPRQQLNAAKNSTTLHSTGATTEQNELSASSPSSSSSIAVHSLENSNNNRIWFFSLVFYTFLFKNSTLTRFFLFIILQFFNLWINTNYTQFMDHFFRYHIVFATQFINDCQMQ